MEPSTLWGKFLVREREEYAFSGPQVWACVEQQLGALNSKRAVQPLLATGLGKEAAFQCGIRMDASSWLPFDEVAFTEDTVVSAALSVRNRTSRRGHRRDRIQIQQEMTSRSQPMQNRWKMSTVPHQHNLVDINVALVITIMNLIMRQDDVLPVRLLQSHNWVNNTAATGVFEKFQEGRPPMTRKRNCSAINTGRASLKIFSRPEQAHRSSTPEVAWRRKRQVGPRRSPATKDRCDLPDNGTRHQLSAAGRCQTNKTHQRRQEMHEQSHCQARERVLMTLHSNLQCTATGAYDSQEMQVSSEYRWNSKQRALAWRQGPPRYVQTVRGR